MKPQDKNYCPYKEYWFGPGDEAQAKPAGFRFKRGALLKAKPGYLSNFRSLENGRVLTTPIDFSENSVVFLLSYDSNILNFKVTDPYSLKSKLVETTEHTFTFLHGEKIWTFVLKTWGQHCKNRHNEMWCKARKALKHPAKKPKKHPKGFCFDD